MSKLNKNGSTLFTRVSEETHRILRQLAAVENKPVCQLVREMIKESIARRRRGCELKKSKNSAQAKKDKPKTNSNDWVDKGGGIF